MTTEGDAIMKELMESISFSEESKPRTDQMTVLIDNVVSSLQSFSPDDINKFFREVNAGLSKRFASVVVSRKFRDLPQGKFRIKNSTMYFLILREVIF